MINGAATAAVGHLHPTWVSGQQLQRWVSRKPPDRPSPGSGKAWGAADPVPNPPTGGRRQEMVA
ncbi:hypothetical protein GCM10009745_14430 [Kribbella yunnanensis]|uniref:Uncharacterized protein n=1 Tax=Kribbella yunnanensis TaxID=190194 RepID=A0ABP4SGR8_9ACTN